MFITLESAKVLLPIANFLIKEQKLSEIFFSVAKRMSYKQFKNICLNLQITPYLDILPKILGFYANYLENIEFTHKCND